MATENPLQATLEQLEAERAQLDATIAYLRQRLGVPDSVGATGSPGRAGTTEIRPDAFFGMTAPDAVKAYLGMVKQPRGASEITKALLAHGFTTSSSTPANAIRTTLGRLADNGEVVQIKKNWGLAEWYPGMKNKRPKKDSAQEDEGPDDVAAEDLL